MATQTFELLADVASVRVLYVPPFDERHGFDAADICVRERTESPSGERKDETYSSHFRRLGTLTVDEQRKHGLSRPGGPAHHTGIMPVEPDSGKLLGVAFFPHASNKHATLLSIQRAGKHAQLVEAADSVRIRHQELERVVGFVLLHCGGGVSFLPPHVTRHRAATYVSSFQVRLHELGSTPEFRDSGIYSQPIRSCFEPDFAEQHYVNGYRPVDMAVEIPTLSKE